MSWLAAQFSHTGDFPVDFATNFSILFLLTVGAAVVIAAALIWFLERR